MRKVFYATIGLCFLSLGQISFAAPMAVNIALSVTGKLKERVVALNSVIKSSNPDSFAFDTNHLPHVTVLQMFIDSKNLDQLYTLLSKNLLKPVRLKVKDFDSTPLDKNIEMNLLNLVFHKQDSLVEFQKKLLTLTGSIKIPEATKDAFVDGQNMDEQFVKYVQTFAEEETALNYSPHITLGIVKKWESDSNAFRAMEEFVFDDLVVVQVGNYGTAQKLLKSFKLKD